MYGQARHQFYDTQKRPFIQEVGARVLNLLNGVKQTTDQFAGLYGLDAGSLQNIIEGNQAPTPEFLKAFDAHGPLRIGDLYHRSIRDQFPIRNDTIDGVVIMTAEQSHATDRKTYRGPEGNKGWFYSYRDAAMSKTSLFRPEWISEHYLHDGVNPELPDWAFNKGHFEHQTTYFIGTVNFHWIDSNGNKHVRAMKTGDADYIVPFVPHTFTTRERDNGLILAVTYGGAIATEDFQDKIQQMSLEEFLKYSKLNMPNISGQLPTDKLGGVIVRHHGDSIRFESSGLALELIGNIPFQPDTSTLEYNVSDTGKGTTGMLMNAERWGYNIGGTPIAMEWAKHDTVLNPGDSFFIKSGVKHSFRGNGKVLVMEMSPEGSNPLDELALIARYSGERGLTRVHSENTQWF